MGGSYAASADTLCVRETRTTDALVASALSVPGMGGSPLRFRNRNVNGGNDPVLVADGRQTDLNREAAFVASA